MLNATATNKMLMAVNYNIYSALFFIKDGVLSIGQNS